MVKGKDNVYIAIEAEAARITFPAGAAAVAAVKPTPAKRKRSRHIETGD